jgi:hypothetical protein
MALQKDAALSSCVEALTICSELSTGDAIASQLAATALGSLPPALASEPVTARLAALLGAASAMAVRIAAAHALFRLGALPAQAHDPLCAMLLDADPNARKVALLTLSPFAKTATSSIARHVAGVPPDQWTLEALQALARTASGETGASRQVEDFLMRSLAGVPLLPAGIAGYAALASLKPEGSAMTALVRVAEDRKNSEASRAALEALGELGEAARRAAKPVADMLVATDDPAREEQLCRTMVRLRATAGEVPVARVLQRLQHAPDRGAAAHCMLLCLHAKQFREAAPAVLRRHAQAGDALRPLLAQTYKALTGTELTGDVFAGKV